MKNLLILLLLLPMFTMAQKPNQPRQGLRLFSLAFHHRQRPAIADTMAARITVTHKIHSSKPSQSFNGWVILTGNRKRYYCEGWEPLPAYLIVQKVKAIQ